MESVAENTSDGVVAPMLYGLLFGAPGALAYKAVNTLDSMVGHQEPPYRELGWASARLDDLANLAPSRIMTLAVAASSGRPLRDARDDSSLRPAHREPQRGHGRGRVRGRPRCEARRHQLLRRGLEDVARYWAKDVPPSPTIFGAP